jgi:predicted hydrolase (HD superfamily)
MLNREDALGLIKKYLKYDRLIKHCYAVEAMGHNRSAS